MENSEMNYFWTKKEIVSYVLSVLVFLIHITSLAVYKQFGSMEIGLNKFIRNFFIGTLPRFAVPLFFIISGAMFFRDYKHSLYLKKIKARCRTLLLPYLIWNTVWVIFEIVTSHTIISKLFLGRGIFEITLHNILEGIFHYGCNMPFWFIFQLMFMMLISPAIYYLVKNKWVAIVFSVLFVIIDELTDIPQNIFYSHSSLVYYVIGGAIGMCGFEKFARKSDAKTQITALALFMVSILVYFVINQTGLEVTEAFRYLYLFIPALSFWYMADLFIGQMKPHNFYKNSFAVYAMHINVQSVICKIIYLILPKNPYIAAVNFVLNVIITLTVINVFCILLKKYLLRVYCIVMGCR